MVPCKTEVVKKQLDMTTLSSTPAKGQQQKSSSQSIGSVEDRQPTIAAPAVKYEMIVSLPKTEPTILKKEELIAK